MMRVIIACALAPAIAQAQAPVPATGTVRGRVFMLGDRSAPGAAASITLRAGPHVFSALAGDDGTFTIVVPPGTYDVVAALGGVGEAKQRVTITDAAIDIELDLRATGEIITVKGLNPVDARRQSAEAVSVIDTEQAQRQTADLAEVLARSSGVGVRRGGGLGSSTRFTLNGLGDEKIRFFLDGVPLEFSGYPFGLQNVPLNLVDRIEVYRGVVPTRFGADALGGAINLVGEKEPSGPHAAASYQTGSFGTQQVTLGGSYDQLPGGLYVRGAGFADSANNDYEVDVEVTDEVGQLTPARVRRFHDGYTAYGVNLETGVKDVRWAESASLRGFVTSTTKELQNNPVMTVPYGEAETGGRGGGGAITYRLTSGSVASDIVLGYAFTRGFFLDDAMCVYDWFGDCVRDRASPGELGSLTDLVWWSHDLYARAGAEWKIGPSHRLRLSLSPTATIRDSKHREVLGARYVPGDDEMLAGSVLGGEYTYADERVEATGFVKGYVRKLRVELADGGESDKLETYPGVGAAARVHVTPWLYAKASYEWAVRLPTSYEVFGDGAQVLASYELAPERAHNLNLGVTAADETPGGTVEGEVNLFLREVKDLIHLVGMDRKFQHFNVYGARSYGAEVTGTYTTPGEYGTVIANATYLELRNSSDDGLFGEYEGDRIPNQPYLFLNVAARGQLKRVAMKDDLLALTWSTRYVHDFYRGWESVGDPDFKQRIASQLVHSTGVTYIVKAEPYELSFALEAQNLADARVYDFFGQQRPGRALYAKTTARF